MRIAVIGATGLTGRSLIPLLADKHDSLLIGRRSSGFEQSEIVAPLEDWPAALTGKSLDVAISALGTTWNKAGNWQAFEAVDNDAVLAFARAAKAAGARQFVTISSVGADLDSLNRYLALKARVEEGLAQLGFDRLDIMRPGLLRGPRGNDRRQGERIGILVSPLVNLFLRGTLDRFAAIDAATVAAGVTALIGARTKGIFIHENRAIHALISRQGDAPRGLR